MLKLLFEIFLPILVVVFLLSLYLFYKKKKVKSFELSETFFESNNVIINFDLKNQKVYFQFVKNNDAVEKLLTFSLNYFLDSFKYRDKKAKIFKKFLIEIAEEKINFTKIKDYLNIFEDRTIFLYSTENFEFGSNNLLNLQLSFNLQEPNFIYGNGNILNFKNFDYFKYLQENKFKFINSEKMEEFFKAEFKRLQLKNYFLIYIYDEKITHSLLDFRNFRIYILELFYVYLKKQYKHVYIDDKYNIYILSNKKFYKNIFLVNRYWKEKIDMIYQDFLEETNILNSYNNLKIVAHYEIINYNGQLNVDIGRAILFFSLMKYLIGQENTLINYSDLTKDVENIYQFYRSISDNFSYKNILEEELIINVNQKKIEKYFLLLLNTEEMDVKKETLIKLAPNLWKMEIYGKFLEEVYKIVDENKSKNYKIIIPVDVYKLLDLALIEKKINLKIYLKNFEDYQEYLKWNYLLREIKLPINRVGVYINNVNYGWEIIQNLSPKYIWIAWQLEKKVLFNLEIEKMFRSIENYKAEKDFAVYIEII